MPRRANCTISPGRLHERVWGARLTFCYHGTPLPLQWSAVPARHHSMDSVPSRRRARLVLLPDSRPSLSCEPSAPSEAPGDGDGDPPGLEVPRQSRELSLAPPSRPLRPSSHDAASPGMAPLAGKERSPQSSPDPSEELGQGLGQGLGWIGGVAIALLTLVVPLTSVVLDRENHPSGLLLPRLPESEQRHGSHNPSGLPSAGVGESLGGDSGRKPQ